MKVGSSRLQSGSDGISQGSKVGVFLQNGPNAEITDGTVIADSRGRMRAYLVRAIGLGTRLTVDKGPEGPVLFSKGAGNGIAIEKGAAAKITGCRVENCGKGIVVAKKSAVAKVTDINIIGCKTGVAAQWTCNAVVERCNILKVGAQHSMRKQMLSFCWIVVSIVTHCLVVSMHFIVSHSCKVTCMNMREASLSVGDTCRVGMLLVCARMLSEVYRDTLSGCYPLQSETGLSCNGGNCQLDVLNCKVQGFKQAGLKVGLKASLRAEDTDVLIGAKVSVEWRPPQP